MSNDQERIAAKIRKLFAIAEDDAASNEEIQNAMAFAKRLMDSHHLTEEDLSHEPQDDYQKVDQAEFNDGRAFVGRKLFYWETILASFVAKFVGVGVYLDHSIKVVKNRSGFAEVPARHGKSVVFFGVAEDTAIAVELYAELRQLISSMALLKWASVYKGDGAKYAQGFVTGLFSQFDKAKAIEKRTSDSHTLILVHRRDDLIKYKQDKASNWLKTAKGIKLRRGYGSGGSKKGSHEAYTDGRADGAKTDVAATRHKKIT